MIKLLRLECRLEFTLLLLTVTPEITYHYMTIIEIRVKRTMIKTEGRNCEKCGFCYEVQIEERTL